MTISVLKTVKFMLSHGFYKTQSELSSIALPVVQLLNGANSSRKKKVVEEPIDPEIE